MIFINPTVELIEEKNPFKKIELAGRTCYKSENKITEDSAVGFVNRLVNAGHLAMVEHAVFCFMTETDNEDLLKDLIDNYSVFPFTNLTTQKITDNNFRIIFSANLRALIENNLAYVVNDKIDFDSQLLTDFRLVDFDNDIKNKTTIEKLNHRYTTMRFICDRGVSHELVRHRLYSFAQESQRYVKYDKNDDIEFIKPRDFDTWDDLSKMVFKAAISDAEKKYKLLRSYGRTAQEARGILPNAIKTEIVVTGNELEWKHFFELRCDKAAHPDMQVVANMAKDLYDARYKFDV